MTKLYVPRNDFLAPLNSIDVQRQTKRSIDVLRETASMGFGTWKIDGDSEHRIGVTRFELPDKNRPEGHMWVQGKLTKKQVTTRLVESWLEEWSSMSKKTVSAKT